MSDRSAISPVSEVQSDPLVEVDLLLQQFARFGERQGLEPVQQLLNDLGNPHLQVPVIHVAGSNGKGSVCAYLSTVLTAAGYRVGRYISPHLVSWCERICLNQQPIDPTVLHQVLLQVLVAIAPDKPSPTQFEVITAAAWLYFAQQQVDVAVIEVGLGGRLDATNVCDQPLVSVITSLSREHWQRLGPTLADIAFEKAGILKTQRPAVVGPLPAEAQAVVERRLAELNSSVVWVEPAVDVGDGWVEYRGLATLEPIRYPLAMQGAVQLTNSAIAIATLQVLQQQGWEISQAAIQTGMANTRWQGRLQWVNWNNQRLLIDGAHNPAGAEALRQFVDQAGYGQQPIHWLMGMLSTKDHADVFQALLRPGDHLYLVPVPGHSSADPQALAVLAHQVCPELAHCQVYSDLMTALEVARSAVPATELLVLCGSLYLIGDFFATTNHQAVGC